MQTKLCLNFLGLLQKLFKISRFIEFASPLITMNVTKYRMIESDESEKHKENFSCPYIDRDEPSVEALLMFVLLSVVVLGITPDLLNLLKNAVLIT